MADLRLGDIIDDFCVKCKRLTNHAVVSMMNGSAAKVRCRTCYNDHDYRKEQAPPSKRDLQKAALFAEALASVAPAAAAIEDTAADLPAVDLAEVDPPAKSKKARKK
jgi:hypothetical protein